MSSNADEAMMFNRLKKLFSGAGAPAAESLDEKAVAIAALLVEAAVADEKYAEAERALIVRLLVSEFGVAIDAVDEIVAEAEKRQKNSVDLHRFASEAKRLSPEEKTALIEALWRIALSDGEKDSFEDMLVRRVCGLIHVSDVDSGLARRRVQETLRS